MQTNVLHLQVLLNITEQYNWCVSLKILSHPGHCKLKWFWKKVCFEVVITFVKEFLLMRNKTAQVPSYIDISWQNTD